MRRLNGRFQTAFTFAFAVLLALSATPASATKTHLRLETFGSAAQPKFVSPNGLAVDQSSGDLLVIDSSASTVSRFNPDGTPADFSVLGTNVIDAKGTGDGTPQSGFVFDSFPSQQIAVDNSGTLTDGNIYVTQGFKEGGNVVNVFASSGEYLGQLKGAGGIPFGPKVLSPCGVAVNEDGDLFVAGFENKIYKFDPSANPPLNTDLVATYTHSKKVCNLAAGAGPSAESVFASTFFIFDAEGAPDNSILKLSSAGLGLQGIVSSGQESRLVAVDPSTGHLYVYGTVSDGKGKPGPIGLHEYDASGSGASLISTSASGENFAGIAIDGDSGRIYVGSSGSGMSVYGPLVTIPDVTTGAAAITGDTSATLSGVVDPDGVALEECFFEYGLTTAYGQKAPCAESVGEIGTSSKAVHADISGLDPEALYHFRLVARNANDTVEGKDQTFRTPGKPRIVGLWSMDVGLNEATIKAKLNPENSPTTYRFEWGATASYGNSTAEIAVGSGEADHVVSHLLRHLEPGSTYHYRVVAANGIGTSESPDLSFTTYPLRAAAKTDCPNQAFRTGPSATLPDCRAYEMVSPVDKNGGDIKVLVSLSNYPARLDQSADDGERFAYSSASAFAGAQSAPWTSEYIATRTEGEGWSTEAINTPRELPSLTDQYVAKLDVQYKHFSEDLSSGWLIHDTNPPLDECAPEGQINLYRRDNLSGDYEALITEVPLSVADGYRLELQGLSTDESRAVFRANAQLTPDAAKVTGENNRQLYEHIREEGGCGELRLVSVLPNGKPATPASVGSGGQPGEHREARVGRAVSADGTRVFWTTAGLPAPEPLYVRVNADREQSTISEGKCAEPELACTLLISAAPAQFWTATTDGSKAYYTVGESLFEFDVDKALAGETGSTLIAEGVGGVTGANEDASRLYFVSEEALGGEGEKGKANLYLREASGATTLVATLTDNDVRGGSPYFGFGVASSLPISNGVRLSADGSHLAFVSTASPTGYDNTDAVTGEPALEVYLYDAESDDLACVSCNPGGGQPKGRTLRGAAGVARRVAAMIPRGESQSFAPRVLSNDGNRLFFESFDALLPRDVNGKGDVYAWQRASSQAECEENGAELYVESAGGCLSLISTGLSPSDTEIADATPDGSNVFIRTAESLLPQDPGQVDLYVARIGGGFPQPPSQPAACEGEACQGPLSPPNDPTPASSAFQGAGNVIDTGPTKPRCRKGKVRRGGRCVPRKARKSAKRARERRAR